MPVQTRLSELLSNERSPAAIAAALFLTLIFPVYMHYLKTSGFSPFLLEHLRPMFGIIELGLLLVIAMTALKVTLVYGVPAEWVVSGSSLPKLRGLIGGCVASVYALVCLNFILLQSPPFSSLQLILEYVLTFL